jgi:hypothetical protein
MPQVFTVVGWALAGAGATSSLAISIGYFLIGAAPVLGGALLLLGGMAMSKRAKKKARAAYNAQQVDRLVNVPTTTGPRELALGRVRKGGVIVFRDSTGSNRSTFYSVIALAAHEIDAVEHIYFDDKKVSLDANGYVTTAPWAVSSTISASGTSPPSPGTYIPGTLVDYSWSDESTGYSSYSWQYTSTTNYARVRTVKGTATQTADAILMSAFPGVWTSAHRLQGVAYLVCQFEYSESAFPSGLPNITAQLRGAKVYDPRSATTVWTQNPALHVRHLLLHPYFGKRTSLTAEEDERIIEAANACDVLYNDGTTNSAIYKSNTVIPFGTEVSDALDDLTQAMCGMWAYAGGQFYLKAGVYTAPELALESKHILSSVNSTAGGSQTFPVAISVHKPTVDKINVIIPKIWDENQDYKEVALPAVKNTGAIASDGKEIPQEITLAAVGNASRANIVSQFIMKDARDPMVVTATFKMAAYPVEMLDNITLTMPEFGFAAKPFMVLGKSYSIEGGVKLTLKETNPAIYDPGVYANTDGYATNTNLVEPWDIAPPTITAVESGTAHLQYGQDGTVITRVLVSWAPITDGRITEGGTIDVQWKHLPDATWNTVVAQGNETSTYLTGCTDGVTIVVKLRSRTTLAVSDWSLQHGHSVVGKLANPSNVTSAATTLERRELRLTWTPISDIDVAGYEVRNTDGNWGATVPAPIFSGNGLAWLVNPTTGPWYVRAYDTTGHYSTASATASFTAAAIPQPTGFTSTFSDTSLTSAVVTLSWTDVDPQFGLDSYELTWNGTTRTIKANSVDLPADWVGVRNYTIRTVDRYGAKSADLVLPVTRLVPNPLNASLILPQVIDNNVLFRWTLPAKTSLPISHIVIKKGDVYATASTIGAKDGEFTVLQELNGGTYTYWFVVVDTEGEESTPVSKTVTVSQPPDYVFNDEEFSTLSGTRSNALLEAGYVVMPVNLTETGAQHHTTNTTPQAQINAGLPIFIQPGLSTGYYEETFNFGQVFASSSVKLSFTGTALAGAPTVAPTLSISTNGVAWTDYPGLTQVFASNFQYVKVRITATQNVTGALYQLQALSVRLDTKLKTDAGTLSVTTATTGTPFNFGSEFVDVTSVTLSPMGTTRLYTAYEFDDTVRTGTYNVVSNVITVSVTAHTLIAGQKVRLSPSTGTLPAGVYTIASAATDSFTINFTTANTSGNVSTYPNSARAHLFNDAGTRVTGTISWTVRGSGT